MSEKLDLSAREFFYSTAEAEAAYFVGERQTILTTAASYYPPGNYRVIDGELFLVVDGLPPVMTLPEDEGRND